MQARRTRLATLALALLALGCGGADERPDATDWDLLVVVLDALPAEALGVYGRELSPPISPRTDAFASEALVFERAFAAASYTLASTASLFTGAAPPVHGVLGLSTNVLAQEHHTLAESLAGAGFATCALSSNPHISEEGAFDQGFATFRHYFRDDYDNHVLPATFRADAGTWWRQHAGQRRFLYAHALPPHQPYDPPAPEAGLFGSDAVPRVEGLTPYLEELSKRTDLGPASPEVLRIRARYDAGVRYADRIFGELLDELGGPDGDGLDDTVVVLLSDHGEAFAQHGRILHGTTVYPEMCRVPLLIRLPESAGLEPARIEGLVGTGDLAATLCELLDVAWPDSEGHKGTSFLARALGEEAGPAAPVLSRSVGEYPLWSLRTTDGAADWCLIEHRASKSRELYRSDLDPGEIQNIAELDTERSDALAARLGELLRAARAAGAGYPRAGAPALVHKDALEALGYFGDEDRGPAQKDTSGD